MRPISRWKAASVHLCASALLALVVIWLVLRIWYPAPFFDALGGRRLIELIVGVDVVLGPLITLIVFDVRKKSLKFDLAAIVVLQCAALVYGVYTAYQARPAYLLFVKDRFEVVTANQLEKEQLDKASRTEFGRVPFSGPVVAAADLPVDPKALETLQMLAVTIGADVQLFPQYYVPYRDRAETVLAKGKTLQQFVTELPQSKTILESALSEANRTSTEVRLLPLYIKQRNLAVIVDARSAEVLRTVLIE